MAYQMDFFAGIESKVLASIGTKVKYPAYVFVRDDVDSETGRLAFVDQNDTLRYIRGENKQHVVKVDVLPDVSEGDIEVLYIVGEDVYVFNGTEFKSITNTSVEELEALTEKVTALEEEVASKVSAEEVDTKVETKVNEVVDAKIETKLTEAKEEILTEVDTKVDEKVETAVEAVVNEKLEEVVTDSDKAYEKVKYEFTDVPEGTLVDYREEEIRIMCPADAVFTKQAVGAGGDASSYYGTLKTYAPCDEAVGYIEHLGDLVDAEILTDLKTDAYGRRYQPSWLALAKCDDAGVWTYYGASSSKEKYIGWDYQIDWYNADGVMIASDSIRINLSNEECHHAIEPYYMAKATVEVEEKITTIEAENRELTEKVTELEQIVLTLENSTPTFIELE